MLMSDGASARRIVSTMMVLFDEHCYPKVNDNAYTEFL